MLAYVVSKWRAEKFGYRYKAGHPIEHGFSGTLAVWVLLRKQVIKSF